MATKAFQKIYTKITQITKATCSLKATGVGYDELASVDGKLAQIVKIAGDEVTLQVFSGTEGIRTNAEVVFMGKAPSKNPAWSPQNGEWFRPYRLRQSCIGICTDTFGTGKDLRSTKLWQW